MLPVQEQVLEVQLPLLLLLVLVLVLQQLVVEPLEAVQRVVAAAAAASAVVVQQSDLDQPPAAGERLGSWEFLAEGVLAVVAVVAAVRSSWEVERPRVAWGHRLALVRASCSCRVEPSAVVVVVVGFHYLGLVTCPVACTAAEVRAAVRTVVGPAGVACRVVPVPVARSGEVFPSEAFADSRNLGSGLVILAFLDREQAGT